VADAVIEGAVNACEVNGPNVTATNSFETPRSVDVRERKLEARGSRLSLTAPAHSVTMLRFGVQPAS
jgi:alpha-L-arabinofuranosidase